MARSLLPFLRASLAVLSEKHRVQRWENAWNRLRKLYLFLRARAWDAGLGEGLAGDGAGCEPGRL